MQFIKVLWENYCLSGILPDGKDPEIKNIAQSYVRKKDLKR